MRKNYLASFFKKYWLINLFCLQALAGLAQPVCPTDYVAGKASVSDTLVCSGATLNFSLSGNTTDGVLLYFLEQSSSPAGPFNVAAAPQSDPSALSIVSTDGVSYYRIGSFCTVGGTWQYSDTLRVISMPVRRLFGTYTINSTQPASTSNFTSFTAAIMALHCGGVSSAVVFNVNSTATTYKEQLILTEIDGASATNTITFKGNGNTVAFASTDYANPAVIKLDGADHIIFDSLNIKSTGGDYGMGIQLTNGADSNIVRRCTIDAGATSTNYTYAGVVLNNGDSNPTSAGNTALNDGNLFENNTIIGGNCGMVMLGGYSASTAAKNNIFRNNDIRDFSEWGIYAGYTDGAIISGNSISRPQRTVLNYQFYGIYVMGGSTNMQVTGNRIFNTFGGNTSSNIGSYGINFDACDATSAAPNIVANNLLYNFNGSGSIYGIYSNSSDYVHFYHNTLSFDNTLNTTNNFTRGIDVSGTATGLEFKNNLVTITRSGGGSNYCIYLESTGNVLASDNNDFYMSVAATNNTGYKTGNRAALSDWQTASGLDAASISIDPLYRSMAEDNYIPNNALADNKGVAVGITADLAGTMRSTSTPDIGAYEFSPLACGNPPAAGTIVTSENPICTSGSAQLSVRGGDLGTGLTYQWQGSPDNTNWINLPGATANKVIVTQTGDTWYRLVSTCGTGNNASPGILIHTLLPTAGVFTINSAQPTGGTNFKSFNDAYNAIKCGINGPVVFNVAASSGPYNEQLIINAISGTSVTNTVTFNGNGNSIVYASSNSNQRAVIKLNGASHIIFNNLVIKATGASSGEYGYGLQLMNNADSNTVSHCTIYSDTTQGSFNYAGIVLSASASDATVGPADCDYNLFEDNTITGGYFGMTLAGSNTLPNVYNTIRRNTFRNFFTYGIYDNNSAFTLIDSNTISRPTRVNAGDFQGIYLTGGQTKLSITRNTLTDPFGGNPGSTNTFYGISSNYADGGANLENVIANNRMYNISGGGNVYGIYNSSSDRAWYYHNTVHLDGAAVDGSYNTYGFYQENAALGIRFNNNIVTISRTGGGAKYALYFAEPASTITSDYNNLYLSAPDGSKNTGFSGVVKEGLAAWQQTGYDTHSTASDPRYKDVATGNLLPTSGDIDNRGKPLSDVVPADFINKTRSTTTPDVGAYEFDPPPCTAPPVAGNATGSLAVVCEGGNVEFNLTGNSTGGGQTYQWQYATTAAGAYTAAGAVLTNPLQTITASETRYYRAAVTCGATTTYSAPLLLTVNNALPGGTYVIDTAGTGDFRNFTEARAALHCGIKGPVVFSVKANSGTYNEQLSLDSTIAGVSAINTITFKGNGNTLHFSSSDYDNRAVITLNGAHYITFDSLKINAEGGGGYAWGVFLTNNADNNTFRNCTIQIPLSGTTGEYAGVVIGSSTNTSFGVYPASGCDSNHFQNNTITGGFCGLCLNGQDGAPATGNQFTSNTVKDFHYYGIYVGVTNDMLVESNDISRPTRTDLSTFYGVYSTGTSNNMAISKNRIHTTYGADTSNTYASYGVYIEYNSAPADKPNTVANNLVYDFRGAGDIYGLYAFFSANTRFYHNTVAFDHQAYTGSHDAYGILQYVNAKTIDIKNNVFTVRRGGTGKKYGIYFTLATPFTSDNNDVWLGAPAFGRYYGYFGLNEIAMSDWQTKTGNDKHSYNADPLYKDTVSNFIPQLAALDNTGAVVGITSDINNVARNTALPDIGAYEFSVSGCTTPPTPGVAAATPSTGMCLGTTIQLSLSGNSVGGFQKYFWQRGATANGPWTNISDSADVPVLLHELASPDAYFRAVVACGTGVAYSTPVLVGLNPYLLAGDYTIDSSKPTGGKNFRSFNEAVAAMHCGIEGSVRFLAVPGTYNERVVIPKIPGVSDSATVTFMSGDGNPASVILTAEATADSNYVVRLDSTNYIRFRNITLTATGTKFGRGLEITGYSSLDSITGCIINIPGATNTDNDIVGIYGTNLRGTDNVIAHNTINSGVTGIYLSGVRIEAQRYNVDSNKVSGSYFQNIYVNGINYLSVSGNTVLKDGLQNSTSFGIVIGYCDTLYKIDHNNITISNTSTTAYGIYAVANGGSLPRQCSVSGNKIIATSGNTGVLYGLEAWSGANANYMNNVIDVLTTADTAYGIYSRQTGGINYYNNTVQNQSSSATSIAAYFSDVDQYMSVPTEPMEIYNNIFSNTGGGIAMSLAVPEDVHSDYNLFYTTGPGLLKFEGLIPDDMTVPPTVLGTLHQWTDTVYTDKHSIVYKPAFAANSALVPDVNSADAWVMQGRGRQVTVDTVDINGNKRATTLTAGVPDLGAYEFLPTVEPVLLTAIPETPAPNSTQTFMLGTDTVTKITWGSVVPSGIKGKRYSGVAPTGLASGQKHMFFYTDFTTTGAAPTGQTVQQFYLDPWRGFIDDETTIKMGETDASAAWQVSGLSQLDTFKNVITDANLTVLNKFTGLTDGKRTIPPLVITTADSSNRGTQFWVGYGHHQFFDEQNFMLPSVKQQMVLYLGAGSQPAHVTVSVNGTEWTRTYTVPANTVITSDYMPKYELWNARLMGEGLSNKGISIQSDVPITAYAHIYAETNSGATMLMPVGTYGYEYYALTSKQNYAYDAYSWFYVIAAYDNTVVEITPSSPTVGGRAAGVPFTVTLQKGQVYQVLGAISGGDDGYDLSGSKIRSISNPAGKCFPVAVFSGSSRTNIGCGFATPMGSGDNIIQQNFPYRAWGKHYLVTPTSTSGNAAAFNGNIFKVLVKDPNTVVKRNGVVLTNLVNNLYYQIETNSAEYIESDQPVMVAQFIPSSVGSECGYTGDGDPEMFYLSPVEQGVKEAALARTTRNAITTQYLTLTIPDKGMSSLTIDGSNTFDYTYAHPTKPGYTVVVKRWEATNGQTFVKSDSAFTGITYGLGVAESYGYNAGTLVNNLNIRTRAAFTNTNNPVASAFNQYTCAGSPFKLKFLSSVQPNLIEWQLSTVSGIQPNKDISVTSPVATDTVVLNGITYYEYTLDANYVINTPGNYNVSVFVTHPNIDACDSRMEVVIPIKVEKGLLADFTTSGICTGTAVQFAGTATLVNNAPVIKWAWNFDDAGATAATQDAVHTYSNAGTYQVQLGIADQAGCIADTTKPVVINQAITAPVVKAALITATTITFSWQPVPGATGYEVTIDSSATWITPSSGATGLTHTVTGLQVGQTVTIKVRALGGCSPAESAAVAATTILDQVFIPNSFTPQNGLAENQYFKVYGNSIKSMRMMVFNQWGEKVFESQDKALGWDGTYKGKAQPSGVYIYVVDIMLVNNQSVTKKGTVNLIR